MNALSPMRVIEAMPALVRPAGLGSLADNDDGGFEIAAIAGRCC